MIRLARCLSQTTFVVVNHQIVLGVEAVEVDTDKLLEKERKVS